MAVQCGIVGLPNVGKSTLFNALTKAGIAAENYPFCTIEPNSGIVEVPDTRLAALSAIVIPQRVVPASDADFYTEFLDYILAVKIVDTLDEALREINTNGTGHSECIVTESYTRADAFLEHADAAAVYVNASTRFTDGGEFGLGAEIGISTQKLHARGPMGLTALTTFKYTIRGSGQIRV